MAKAAATKETTEETPLVPDNAPQLKDDYKPDANVLTDNRRSDYDQPNLQNPNSEKVERNMLQDGMDNQHDFVNHGRSDKKEIKKEKPFKGIEDATKYIGKQVVVGIGYMNDFFGEATAVSKDGVMVNGATYPFSAVAPWQDTEHYKDNIYEGDPAYDINVKHGYGSETEGEDKKKRDKKLEEAK